MIKVALFGLGVTGNALDLYLQSHKNCDIKRVDPAKGMDDDVSQCSVAFINVPTPTNEIKDMHGNFQGYAPDYNAVKDCIKKCPKGMMVVIRSTMQPGATRKLMKQFNRELWHMPEFLTERSAISDMTKSPVAYIGSPDLNEQHFLQQDLFKLLFPDKDLSYVDLEAAELIKQAHNCFGAMKVTYWNMIYDICQRMELSYETIRTGCLEVTPFINPTHTFVPGPDGKLGFGGKCFPDNMKAMVHFFEQHDMAAAGWLEAAICLNAGYRQE